MCHFGFRWYTLCMFHIHFEDLSFRWDIIVLIPLKIPIPGGGGLEGGTASDKWSLVFYLPSRNRRTWCLIFAPLHVSSVLFLWHEISPDYGLWYHYTLYLDQYLSELCALLEVYEITACSLISDNHIPPTTSSLYSACIRPVPYIIMKCKEDRGSK